MRIAKKVASLAFKVSLGGVLLLAIIITEPTLLATSFIEYKVPTGLNGASFPMSITTGPDGNLWYTDSDGVQVVRVTTSGVFTVYPMPAKTPSDKPDSITTGPDGNLWFTTGPGNSIDKLTTAGTLTEYPLPNLQSGPDGITVGPDGNLWFTEDLIVGSAFVGVIGKVTTSGVFTEYPVPPNSLPQQITVGPDGNLWFTDSGSNDIAEVSTGGSFIQNPLPTSNSFPNGITVGPDNNIWFTEVGSPPRVGELVLSPSVHLQVAKFFTDSSLNPLPRDSIGNPKVDVVLANGVVTSTNPGQVLAWINVTNTSGSSLQALKLNDTLPVDWMVSPAWIPPKGSVGAIHVFYANGTSLASETEITQPSTITVSTGNPETVQLAISNFTSTTIGHPLMPGQRILLSLKLTYGLIHTSESASSFARNSNAAASQL